MSTSWNTNLNFSLEEIAMLLSLCACEEIPFWKTKEQTYCYKYSTIPLQIQYNTVANTVQYWCKYSTILLQIQYNTVTNTVQYRYKYNTIPAQIQCNTLI